MENIFYKNDISFFLDILREELGCRYIYEIADKMNIAKLTVRRWSSGKTKISRKMALKIVRLCRGKIKMSDLRPDLEERALRGDSYLKRYLDMLKYRLQCKNYTELANRLETSHTTLYDFIANKRGIPLDVAKKMVELSGDTFSLFDLCPQILDD